jgi:RNA-directed DNA polymerase
MFMSHPYNLEAPVATILAQICCHNNQLPQDAPTSPIISNMICAKMDSQLQRLAKESKATYTRYADDITFSTTLSSFPDSLGHFAEDENNPKFILSDNLVAIIINNGFRINERKIRLQSSRSHQEVTGLTVNKFPNVDRNYVRQIRGMLHAWEKFGLLNAQEKYQERITI